MDAIRSKILPGTLPDLSQAGAAKAGAASAGRDEKADVAKQFEEVLVREFVRVMTKDVFGSGLAGEQGPGWVKASADSQADALTDAITQQLVDSGRLGVADMLMRRWSPPTANRTESPISIATQPTPLTPPADHE